MGGRRRGRESGCWSRHRGADWAGGRPAAGARKVDFFAPARMRRTNLAAASSSSSSSSLLPPRRHRRRVMASFQDAEDEARKAIADGFEMCVPFVVVQKDRDRDRVESSLIIFIARRRRPPPPPPPPPPSPVPPSDALPQLHPPRDARSRAMNMRDAETGEMMWEKHAWPSAWRSEEVEARVPADVMNRAAVSREMTFSSAAAIDDFRVSARLHRVLGSRGARAILKDSDSSHSSRFVLRPRRPLTPSPDRATKKFNPFLRSTVATARLPRRALHRRVGLRLRVRDPGQRQHVADDDRERGRGRDVRPDADKRIRCVLYTGPHTTAFAL